MCNVSCILFLSSNKYFSFNLHEQKKTNKLCVLCCQVDVSSKRYHLTPVTLLYAATRSQQGLLVITKGLGSVFTVKALTLATEDVISKFSPLPK